MKITEVMGKLRFNRDTIVRKIQKGELKATLSNTFNGKLCHEYWSVEQKDLEEYFKRYE